MYAVNNFIPPQLRGPIDVVLKDSNKWKEWYPWLKELQGTNGFIHLSANWGINKEYPKDPDAGFNYYILSGDSGMSQWDEHVAKLHNRPVYMITLPEVYSNPISNLVKYIPISYYHRQISILSKFCSPAKQKNIKYKASALTSRTTQSKLIVFSALNRILGDDLIFSLRNNFDLRDVHNWEPTHNKILDELSDYFQKNWLSKTVKLHDDDGNPLSVTNPAYSESSLNFTQESFHYSLMYDKQIDQEYIISGPFLTEKTFKCLLSQTAFVPVGQFRSYRWLETMGMEFNYGLDLTFDNDPGNITRLLKLISLIEDISQYTAADLFEMTEKSNRHNYSIIATGEFFDRSERINQEPISRLYEHILG
jgi:hypothetical protein